LTRASAVGFTERYRPDFRLLPRPVVAIGG
jgi:hypothetical protein